MREISSVTVRPKQDVARLSEVPMTEQETGTGWGEGREASGDACWKSEKAEILVQGVRESFHEERAF